MMTGDDVSDGDIDEVVFTLYYSRDVSRYCDFEYHEYCDLILDVGLTQTNGKCAN